MKHLELSEGIPSFKEGMGNGILWKAIECVEDDSFNSCDYIIQRKTKIFQIFKKVDAKFYQISL